jgi:dephospho-CoA kinase
MKSWVITGGAGCGKSTAARYLHSRVPGAELFDADSHVHQLLREEGVIARIESSLHLSEVRFDAEGGIDRRWLGEIVFGDEGRRKALEEILHPLVSEKRWQESEAARTRNARCFIAEIPLYFEAEVGFEPDLLVVVGASRSVQEERLAARRVERGIVASILDLQWPIWRKVGLADYVIWNDGDLEVLRRQMDRLVATESGRN